MSSSVPKHNARVFYNAKPQVKKLLIDRMKTSMYNLGEMLVINAWNEHGAPMNGKGGWSGFTGNTQTSYAFGIYVEGNLTDYYVIAWDSPTIKHVKIKFKQHLYLKEAYEGGEGERVGMVPIVEDTGEETSVNFLKSYKPNGNYLVDLVVCTGTEYSDWLEKHHGNVLTLTKKNAPHIYQNWKTTLIPID